MFYEKLVEEDTELIELVRDDLLDVQKAAERAGMTLEEFQAAMKKE